MSEEDGSPKRSLWDRFRRRADAPPEPELPPALTVADIRTFTDEEKAAAAQGWTRRLTAGLGRSTKGLGENLAGVFQKKTLDEAALAELEDALVAADLGVETANAVAARLRETRFKQNVTEDEVKSVLAEEVAAILKPFARPLLIDDELHPHVILVVGVNGSGKTTTIGKMAARYRAQGLKTLIVAGDTFRAAAIEQLQVWGRRADVPVESRQPGADAAGLCHDALAKAKAEGVQVMIVDTAGRLQNKQHLMAELDKVVRVMKKLDEEAPRSVILVLDATVGQNALAQVEVFRQVCNVSGLVVTKLDGTARGGVLVPLARKFALPIHAVGVGESIDDLAPFDAADFARALCGLSS